MTVVHAPLLLAAVPALSAAAGWALWNQPRALKAWLQFAALTSLVTVVWASGRLPADAAPLPLLAVLPVAAFASLLAQPIHRSNRGAWMLTMLLLGLGLGVLAFNTTLSLIVSALLLAVLGLVLVQFRRHVGLEAWWGAGTAGFGTLAFLVAAAAPPPVSSLAFTLACAVILPLMPFHMSYVAALTGLPGNLPAFLAVLLPVAGFHGILTVLPQLPQALTGTVEVLALAGMVYGSMKALAQTRPASVVAYGSSTFVSILWWYLATTRTAPPHTIVFLSAVGLASAGLLLSWYMLRSRHGEFGLGALGGLARSMPRFGAALSLLALAALGLPPFGPFAGFVGMLLAPSFTWSGGLIVVMAAWLCASWYLFDFVQGLLFGRTAVAHRHQDLRGHELASLAIVLVLLCALGVMPTRLFDPGVADAQRTFVLESSRWTN